MAGIEAAIRSVLVADASVDALVDGRIYPWMRQQGSVFPAIVYELDDTEPSEGLGGHLDLTRVTITINSIAETYSAAKELASDVRAAMNGYTGTSEGVVIKSVIHDNDTGIVEDSEIGNSRGVSTIVSEYIIWYES